MKKTPEINRGFALIVTISMMVLLMIIAVGMLSLSSITLRTTAQEWHQANARANARLALMIAIGELQKYTGPDTRITAPSGIVDENAPPLTGVWRSWEGSNHESSGRPVIPDYGSKTRAATDNGGRFLKWLVSGAADGASPTDPAALAFRVPTDTSIPLLSTGTLAANDPRQVHVIPQPVNDTGTMAWWVSGENQKARLSQPYKPNIDNASSWSDIAKSHSVADPKPLGLDSLLDENSEAAIANNRGKVISLSTADFLAAPYANPKPRQFFHDLSVSSIGLLTNAATGGWRKDLSLLTENWDQLPASGLPLFRIAPEAGQTSLSERPTPTNPRSAQSIFYPWSGYRGIMSDAPLLQHGAVTSWQNLVEYATAYKRIAPSTDGNGSIPFSRARFFIFGTPLEIIDTYNYLHTIRTSPVIARIQWVFSHWAPEITPATTPKTYRLHLLITPVVTLWNPHNVTVTTTADGIMPRLVKSPPCVLLYYNRQGTETVAGRRWILGASDPAPDSVVENYTDMLFPTFRRLGWRIPGDVSLLPGETRVFSAASAGEAGSDRDMIPGYNPTGGHIRRIDFIGDRHREGDQVKLDIKFDNLINMGSAGNPLPGSGIWLEVCDNKNNHAHIYERHILSAPLETAQTYWPEIKAEDLPMPNAEDLTGGWTPFFSTVYGFRMGSPTNLPGRGLMQSNPLARYSLMEAIVPNPGARHPANATMDYSFFAHALGGDDKLPNADNANDRGYIISGFQAGQGLSRMILSEFPLRPLASLAELQNWNLRGENPIPPFQLNIIGNSDASPLLPANQVFNPVETENMQHDDAYCANHLLFDDWFLSSIAPEPANFGNSISADIKTRYTQFLDGNQPLANRSYVRIVEDQSLDPAARDALVEDMLESGIHDSWQRIASRLEVEGMFNVNSTSVTAWRALLGHARNRKVPHYTENGISLSGVTNHAFSRSVVAGDVQAGAAGSMSGAFPGSSELTGYRVFDDGLLDSLAEKIVEQVRLRGPFLSLSEFVNRQLAPVDAEKKLDSLTANERLALAGAIQTALNEMAIDAGNNDPHKTLKEDFSEITLDPGHDKVKDAGYRFAAAATGHSNYGLPGWIRQADVLRPLAPILSARDDTFTIRAYGDARDQNGKILATAWCEATVRRTRNFVDPVDPADSIDAPVSQTNVVFGRRYEISTFRWLSPHEV